MTNIWSFHMHQFLFVKGKKKTEKGYLLRYFHSFSMDVFKRRALKLNLTFFKTYRNPLVGPL